MFSNLSGNAQRALALGLLALLLLVVVMLLVLPLRNAFSASDERIAELQFRLQKYSTLAGRQTQIRAELEALLQQDSSGEELLGGASTAIAGANLQALLKQVVQQAGGRLESTQALPEVLQGAMERIAIRAQFSGNIEALQQVLHGIEFRKPLLFIDKMEVRIKRVRRSRIAQQELGAGQQLSVSLQVSGFRRLEAEG
ncbi:MAG: type II secretion system protein M [Gammaproteobacteria bacterium]|nr:type II secretion system protein M [Gammaproteobacteria bacterium]